MTIDTRATAAAAALLPNRRQAMLLGGSAPLLAGLAAVTGDAGPAAARTDPQGAGQPLAQRFGLGTWEVTPVLAGMGRSEAPQKTFGLNVSAEDFARVSAEAFIPPDWSASFMIPTLVNTGAALVLFDTGMQPAGLLAGLAAAGVGPEQVDVVVLTHLHPDHIGGLMAEDGTPVFTKARFVTGRIEFDHWAAAGSEAFEAKVRPLAEQLTFLEDGGEVVPGITAMAAFGHTPGHMVFHLESDGNRLVLTADTANHYVWSLQNPDWEVRFDADKAMAAATRRRIFGMLAAEKLPFIGYHMPFPGLAYVETAGSGFRYVPQSYQHALFP